MIILLLFVLLLLAGVELELSVMRHVVCPDRVDLRGVRLRFHQLVVSTGRGGSGVVQHQHVQHLVTRRSEPVFSGRVMLL